MSRGEIQNRERARQIANFSGLRIGKITPTDIDGLIEYENKMFFFFELKSTGVELGYGQNLAFERLINSLDKPSILIVSDHNTSASDDIDASKTIVRKYYYNRRWLTPKRVMTLREAVDEFIKHVESQPL